MSSYCFFQILFWIPVGLLFYSYVLYPLFLELFSLLKLKSQPLTTNHQPPTVSILLSVYNEEKVIEEKIKNIFECDYPKDKLEIIIGNDCSNDRTFEILNQLTMDNGQLTICNFEIRRGKPSVLNDLVKKSSGEIILLTDANILFEKDAIQKLVAPFSYSKVGLVGGNILNKASGEGISNQEKTYITRENRIKFLEGKNFGSMIGPFGGFYALRKNLYRDVPENFLVDDFFICMNVLKQNFKSIAEPGAIAYEEVSEDWKQEFKRKARIGAGNFQNLIHFESLLLRFNATSFCFFSHKVLRWLGPFFLIGAFLSNIIIVTSFHPYLYLWTMRMQILFFFTPIIMIAEKFLFRRNISSLNALPYFYTMNLALLIGWFRFIKGIKSGVWTPTKR